ncbi:MAG: VanZ family protein [Ignavibacteriales bacterium]
MSTILLAFLFGFLNELHQLFIVSRTFNKFDLLANVMGTIMVILVIKFTTKFIRALKI